MRWTLAVSVDRKVFVAIVDSEGIGQQSVPNVARMVKEAKGENGKGQGKKGKSGKGKTDDGKEKGKGKGDKWQACKTFEGYCNHCWIWGHREKDCFTKAKTKGKGKSVGGLGESAASVPENTSVGGSGLCSFGNSQHSEWKWNDCRKVTFTLDSGAAVSVAPKSLGDDYPIVIEEPRLYRTATGESVQDEGFRVLPTVTEEGFASLHEFQSGTCSQSTGVSFESVPQRSSNHSGFRAWSKWHASQTHERMDCVKKKGSTFSTVGFLRQ